MKKTYLSNPAPGENLESGNLVMETGCIVLHPIRRLGARAAVCAQAMMLLAKIAKHNKASKQTKQLHTSKQTNTQANTKPHITNQPNKAKAMMLLVKQKQTNKPNIHIQHNKTTSTHKHRVMLVEGVGIIM